MSETPVCEVCGRAKLQRPFYASDHLVCGSEEECYRLGYERARAALSAAEKREARLREALERIHKIPLSVVDIACAGRQSPDWGRIVKWMQEQAEAALKEASAASEAQPPPKSRKDSRDPPPETA